MRRHLSPSQLDMIARCPQQWYRRYIAGEIAPPGIAMLKGTGMHAAAAVNGRQKIRSRRDLPIRELREIAAEEFATQTAGGYMLSIDEESRGVKVVLAEAKDQCASLAQAYGQCQAPEYQPVLVEEKFTLALPNVDMVGVIDMVDRKGIVVDWKTTSRAKSQADVWSSVQLTCYASAVAKLKGRLPLEVRLDCLVEKSKGIERAVVSAKRTPQHFAALSARINSVMNFIDRAGADPNAYPPADPGCWQCNSKWCGFARTCRFYCGDDK